jgi:hypothetical protein
MHKWMKNFDPMKKFLANKKRLLTLVLALIGIAVTLAYDFCFGACSSLSGTLLGMDLKYLGMFYMAVIFVLGLLRKSLLCLLLLSFGAGGELVLIGYQVFNSTYCPYCLVFAATVFLALGVNFNWARRGLSALAAVVGLGFFLLFFSGSLTPAYAAEPSLPAFGRGPVEVRVYTDYFCVPCRNEEAEVMALVTTLTEKNRIRVTFIDTPIHRDTALYAGFFLAAVNAKDDFSRAVFTRAALFEAAGKKISGKEELGLFLKNKGISLLPLDAAPIFKIFNKYMAEDRVNSTPTFVIDGPNGKQTLIGKENILPALLKLSLPE